MSDGRHMADPEEGAVILAEGAPETGGTGAQVRVCLISVAGELFAIDLRQVREVFEVEAVTPVPGLPPVLTGVTNLRGAIIPLVDLRVILGQGASDAPLPFAVVVRHGIQQVGVLVDDVPQIVTARSDQFLASPPGTVRGARPFVSSVLRVADRMGGVVEVPTLLAYVEAGGG